MKLKLTVDNSTTADQLFQLGALFTGLAIGQGTRVSSGDVEPVFTVPADPAELTEPEVVQVPATDGTEPPKRRRRTKAELEAEKLAEENAAVATAEAEAQASNEAALAAAGNDQPAPTPAAPQQDTPPSETASTAPASASPSSAGKDYTEAEVQDLAGKVARGVGPEVVKEKIAALGASRIAELTQQQRNELGVFLTGKLS